MNELNYKKLNMTDIGTYNLISYTPDVNITSSPNSRISDNLNLSQNLINNNYNGKFADYLVYSTQLLNNLITDFFSNSNLLQINQELYKPINNSLIQKKIDLVNLLDKSKFSNYKRRKHCIKEE